MQPAQTNTNTVLIVIILIIIAAVGGAWWYRSYHRAPAPAGTSGGLQINLGGSNNPPADNSAPKQ